MNKKEKKFRVRLLVVVYLVAVLVFVACYAITKDTSMALILASVSVLLMVLFKQSIIRISRPWLEK